MRSQWIAQAAALARWVEAHLVNRLDVYGTYRRVAGKVIGAVRKNLTFSILKRHFRGEIIVGLHTTSKEDTCRSVTIDIDRHRDQDADPIKNEQAAIALYERVVSLGGTPLLEDSNGSGGYHLSTIFQKPIPAEWARRFGEYLVQDWQQLGLARKPEVYPKQASLQGRKTGNWLRLFGKHHTRQHWSLIWNGSTWLTGAAAITIILSLTGADPAIIPEECRQKLTIKPPRRPSSPRRSRSGRAFWSDVRSALSSLPTDFCEDYDRWLRVGMSLYPLGDEGLELLGRMEPGQRQIPPGRLCREVGHVRETPRDRCRQSVLLGRAGRLATADPTDRSDTAWTAVCPAARGSRRCPRGQYPVRHAQAMRPAHFPGRSHDRFGSTIRSFSGPRIESISIGRR